MRTPPPSQRTVVQPRSRPSHSSRRVTSTSDDPSSTSVARSRKDARLLSDIVAPCATIASPPSAAPNTLADGSTCSPVRVTTTRSALGMRSGSSARRLAAPTTTASLRSRSACIRFGSSA